ncbi:MAG: hypothetical protein AABY10_03245 [Nanoarchaeota archaeon]
MELELKVKKAGDLNFIWAKGRNIKKSTSKIMEEIDEGEIEDE